MNVVKKRILFLLIPLVYLFQIIIFSRNIPLGDDYIAIVNFFSKLKQGSDISYFDQFFGHFIVPYRYVHAFFLCVTGELQFKAVVISWNLLFILSLSYVFFSRTLKENTNSLIVVFSILFSLQYYTSSIWAVLFLSNIFFAASTFVLVFNKNNVIKYLAMLVALFGVINSGNGIAISIAVSLALLFTSNNKFLKITWFLFTVVSIVLLKIYFDFGKIQGYESNLFLHFEIENIGIIIKFFCVFLSSVFFDSNTQIFIIIKIIIAALSFIHIGVLIKRRYYERQPIIFGLILFVIFTALMVTYGRSNLGVYMASVVRYKVYSALYFGLLLFSVYEVYAIRKGISFFLQLFFMLFFLYSLLTKIPILNLYANTSDFGSFLYTEQLSSKHLAYPNKQVENLLTLSNETEVYNIPQYKNSFISEELKAIALPKYEARNLKITKETVSQNKEYVYIEVLVAVDGIIIQQEDSISICLVSGSESYNYKSMLQEHHFFFPRNPIVEHFSYILVPKKDLQAGTYKIYCVVKNSLSTRYKFIDTVIIE